MTQMIDLAAVPTTVPQDRLRVTVIQQGGTLGGAERWQLQLADATDRIAVEVISLGDGPATQEWERRGVRVSSVRMARGAGSIPLLATRVGAVLGASRPHVVVAHGVKPALVASPAARAHGVPLVWVRHDGSYGGWPTAVLDRLSAGQVSTGSWLFEGRRPSNPLLLNPPRADDHLSRDAARDALGLQIPAGRLVAGMGTRIVHGKGIDDAISALADPGAAAWDLMIAGIHDPEDPGEQDRLLALASDLGVEDRVRFLGEVPGFSRFARAFDAVLVLTKPTATRPWHREAFGMAAFEALTAGVPVVGTPPLGDMVREGGVEVRAGAPADVAAALQRLESETTRNERGAAGARIAASYPDAPAAAETLVDFLARIAHRPGAGLAPTGTPMSVVATVLDEEAAAKDLLSTLVPQLGQDDEIVLVDRGSVDGTVDVVRSFAAFDPRIRLVLEPGAGRSRGLNAGVRVAAHDRIATTDLGAVPASGWLGAFRRAFASHPEIDLWAGIRRFDVDAPWHHALGAVEHGCLPQRGGPIDPLAVTTGSLAFARVAWASVGGLPEHVHSDEADIVFGDAIVAGGGRADLVREAEVDGGRRPTWRTTLRRERARARAAGGHDDPYRGGAELATLVAGTLAAVLAVRGSMTTRGVVAGGVAAVLARPVTRSLRGPEPLRTAALVPPAVAVHDLTRSYGALVSALRRMRDSR